MSDRQVRQGLGVRMCCLRGICCGLSARNNFDRACGADLLLTTGPRMPKTDTGEENGNPRRRYTPRPCILCALDIRDHYLDRLEAKIQAWVDMFAPAMDTSPSGLKEEKNSENGQPSASERVVGEGHLHALQGSLVRMPEKRTWASRKEE